MRFNEWQSQLETLHEKTQNMLVDEEILNESITIDGKTYSIYLGDNIIYRVDSTVVNEWQFKSAYSATQGLWQMMLGSLETKISMALSLNDLLFEAIAEKYLKEEVLERLTGVGGADSDNLTVIRKAANKRIAKLQNLLPKYPYFGGSFVLPNPSKVYILQISYPNNSASGPYVAYGDLPNARAGIKCCWNFLQNYEQIETTFIKFVELWKPVIKMVEK